MKRPNIIFFLTDDQGYGDLGCTGNPWIKTPNIDQFYEESVRMTNYHVGPTCAPTRSGLMTGHYANSTGVWHTVGGRSLLRADEWSIANAFSENGYATGIFGKWHLGDSYPYRPEDRGFQEVVVHGGGGISQTPDYWGNDYFDDTYRVNGEYKKFDGYCSDVFFTEAKKFIYNKNKENQPFFCYIATNAPHAPYNVEAKYADMYRGQVMEDRARFYGMISNLDENFGQLREFIKEEKLDNNTIVIYMTDNGSSNSLTFDKDGNVIEGYNAGLRGMKNSEYDGGHRVPFFIRYPEGNIGGGRDCNELAANVDFMPTLLDFCGISYTEEAFHGLSLKAVMESAEEKMPERIVVTDSQRVPNPIKWRKSAVMKGEMRLVNGVELYDVAVDRMQENDIAKENPKLVGELSEAYDKWWDVVSVKFEEPIPLYLSRPTKLVAHDWRGDEHNCLWGQNQVRMGRRTTGHWEILVEDTTTFRIKLYRWASETGYTLCQGIDGNDSGYDKDFIDSRFMGHYEGGESIGIVGSLLILDGVVVDTVEHITDDMKCVEYKLTIEKGNHLLEGKFIEYSGTQFGSYYAEVEPMRG